MLKYFGLKEIFFGLKKFKIGVLIVTIVFGIVGTGLVDGKSDFTETTTASSTEYSTSRSYLITAEPTATSGVQDDSDKTCAATIATMLKADFSKQYVYNKLLEDYTEAEIIEYTYANTSVGDGTYKVLDDAFVVNAFEDSAIVNFYSVVADELFSQKVTEYLDQYLNETIVGKIPNLKEAIFIGGTTVLLASSQSAFAGEGSSAVKEILVFMIVGFVLSVCVVLLFVLLKPSIATRKDFEEYGVLVIDDAQNHKNNKLLFAVDALLNESKKQNCETVGIISTITSKKFCRDRADFMKKLKEMSTTNDIMFSEAKEIIANYSEFTSIKKTDGVVLIERKGETYHNDFCNTYALLSQHGVSVIGVILI